MQILCFKVLAHGGNLMQDDVERWRVTVDTCSPCVSSVPTVWWRHAASEAAISSRRAVVVLAAPHRQHRSHNISADTWFSRYVRASVSDVTKETIDGGANDIEIQRKTMCRVDGSLGTLDRLTDGHRHVL